MRHHDSSIQIKSPPHLLCWKWWTDCSWGHSSWLLLACPIMNTLQVWGQKNQCSADRYWLFLRLVKFKKKNSFMLHIANFPSRCLTMLGATADPEVQQLVFLGLWGLPGVIAQPHPQTSPRPCHLQRSTPCFTFIWAEKKCWLSPFSHISLLFYRGLNISSSRNHTIRMTVLYRCTESGHNNMNTCTMKYIPILTLQNICSDIFTN